MTFLIFSRSYIKRTCEICGKRTTLKKESKSSSKYVEMIIHVHVSNVTLLRINKRK